MAVQGNSHLGYAPSSVNTNNCAQGCHSSEKAEEWRFGDLEEFEAGRKKHKEKNAACSACHGFDR